jgi:calcineurin-like phosphoesterase family protein
MTTFFTSDLHMGHARIVELCNRPFADVDEMNQTIIDRWNAIVTSYDRVYILGDLALGKLDDSLALVAQLNGDKYLVPGNHDRVWPGYSSKGVRPVDRERYEAAGLAIMPPIMVVNGSWTLCHFPDTGDSHDADRYDSWRPPTPAEDEVLIHGHTHSTSRLDGNRIHVGMDAWDYRPVREADIKVLLAARVLVA